MGEESQRNHLTIAMIGEGFSSIGYISGGLVSYDGVNRWKRMLI